MKLFSLCLLLVISVTLGKGWHWLRDGFSLSRVVGWSENISYWSPDLDPILDQPFYSLGKGQQCFAFASRDGNYVIKVARHDKLSTPLWLRIFKVDEKKIERKKEELLTSFSISFLKLQEETGVLGILIAPKKEKWVKLVDSLGRTQALPLHRSAIVLQKKRKLFKDVYQRNKGTEETSKLLDQVLKVVSQRAEKGVMCNDGSFLKNYGFDQDGAYQIDIGSFSLHQNYSRSIKGSMYPIRDWFVKEDPRLVPLINEKLEHLLGEKQ